MTLPKRIWAVEEPDPWNSVRQGVWDDEQDGQTGETEYIRADLIEDWQPFETAPRNGTEILVYVPHSGIISAWFYRETGMWPHDEPYNEHGEPCNVGCPTHWRPLPPYPES